MVLTSNIILCICAFIGFVYGAARFLKPKKAVFAQMITLAVGCAAFGRLYQVVRLMTGGEIIGEFQLGVFGVIGSLLFLLSANFGTMDSLGDDGSKAFRKYRIIALIAPITTLAFYLAFICFANIPVLTKVIDAVIAMFVMLAGYYHLKHLILPDVDYGVINCLKSYNALALAYSGLCIAEMIATSRGSGVAELVISILTGMILIVLTPSVERGIYKWTH